MPLLHRSAVVAGIAGLVLLAAGCGSGATPSAHRPTVPSSSSPSAGTTTAGGAAEAPAVAAKVSKLMVVVLENHSRAQALAQMPSLSAQAARYGQATSWYAVRHPSLPNYLVLTGGSTSGVGDDRGPASHRLHGPSVLGQLAAHHHDVRVYAEGQNAPCETADHGRYAVRHNAWTYFVDPAERALCRRYDLPAGTTTKGALHDDVAHGTLPSYSQVVPDLCHDAHDCRLVTADRWLEAWLEPIEAAPDFRSGRLAVVVTFDEDDRHAGNQVATAVLAAQLHHRVVRTRFTHASLAAAPSRLVGLPPLRDGAGSPDVLKAFGLT